MPKLLDYCTGAVTQTIGQVTGANNNIIQITTNNGGFMFTVTGNWWVQGLINWSDGTVSKTSQNVITVQQALA